jgi:integrase
MVQKALSDVAISNLKTVGAYYDKLPGFGIRIGKNRKSFFVVRNGRRQTLGIYPHLSLSDARRLATLTLYGSKAVSASLKCSEAIKQYLDQLQVKERTKADYARLLDLHLKPKLGNKDISKITTNDVLGIIDKLIDTPAECYHAFAALKTFFNWCVPRYLPQSPMAGLKCPTKPNERDRILTDDELKAVWNASHKLGNYGNIIQIIILLALRKVETLTPRSLNQTTVTLLDTKSGVSHVLPITPLMHKLFSEIEYSNGWSKNKARLDKLSKIAGYTHHDLRRTTASNLARLGTDPFIVERILNHSLPKVQRIYNRHDYTESMRKPLEDHQAWLLKLVENC